MRLRLSPSWLERATAQWNAAQYHAASRVAYWIDAYPHVFVAKDTRLEADRIAKAEWDEADLEAAEKTLQKNMWR